MASVQLPQPTRSQAVKPDDFDFQPQHHMVSLSAQSEQYRLESSTHFL